MSYKDKIAEDARLYILKELEKQADGHLNEISIRRILEINWGIDRTREWIVTQLRKLEELEAVELHGGGEILIAHITRDGRNHLAERSIIAAITRPAEIE